MLAKSLCNVVVVFVFFRWQLLSYEKVHSGLTHYFFNYPLSYELCRIPQTYSSLKICKVFKFFLVSFLDYCHHIGFANTGDEFKPMYPWSYRLRHIDVLDKALFI